MKETIEFYTNNTVTAWQGIRFNNNSNSFLIAGSTGFEGTLFIGDITGNGQYYTVKYPNASATSVYGPDNVNDSGEIRLVGIYKIGDTYVRGFIYQGTVEGLSDSKNYEPYYNEEKLTYLHSTDGKLVVGTIQDPPGYMNCTECPVKAFMYNVQTKTTRDIVYPGAISTTAYGVQEIQPNIYAICGGFSYSRAATAEDIYISVNNITTSVPFDKAYLAKYDLVNDLFYDWVSFVHPNNGTLEQWTSHFEGLSYDAEEDIYYLSADSINYYDFQTTTAQGSHVTVKCNFLDKLYPCEQEWVDINLPNFNGVSSSNSVAGNNVVGLGIDVLGESFVPYQAFFPNNTFTPENSTCEFYFNKGVCTVYVQESLTVSINGCNALCSGGNQTVAVNSTGVLEYLQSDNSCGGCFVGTYTVPTVERNSIGLYTASVTNNTVLALYESCAPQTNCTGQILVQVYQTSAPSTSPSTSPSRIPTMAPTNATNSNSNNSNSTDNLDSRRFDVFIGLGIAFMFVFSFFVYYFCLRGERKGMQLSCGSCHRKSKTPGETRNFHLSGFAMRESDRSSEIA